MATSVFRVRVYPAKCLYVAAECVSLMPRRNVTCLLATGGEDADIN